jgi:tetratricopeptide (TPR) repeat protein
MRLQKGFLFFLLLLLCYSFSYAGELAINEAVNYFNAGLKAQKDKNYTEAELNYRKTLLLDTSSIKWPLLIANNRGVMCMENGDLDGAEQYFLEALQIDPGFRPAQINYGFVLDKRDNELKSIKYWMDVLHVDLQKLKPKDLVLAREEQEKKAGVIGKADW